MKKLLTLILLFVAFISNAQDPLVKNEVEARRRLKAVRDFIWQGDTIKKDSIAYIEISITGDSIKIYRLDGRISNWIYPGSASGGAIVSVTGTAPIYSSGGTTPNISISPATTTNAGSLSAADKTTIDNLGTAAFNNTEDFIQNQNTAQQPADFWISGAGKANIFEATTAKLTNLTDGYLPYSTASGLVDSPVYTDGTNVTVYNGYFFANGVGNSLYASGASVLRGGITDDTHPYLTINGGTSGYTYFNSNVGIGTTAPIGKLTISGSYNVGFNAGVIGSPQAGNLFYETDGTGWRFDVGKYQAGVFSPQMTFTDNGNVGIGTTAPTYKLVVSNSGANGMEVNPVTGTNGGTSLISYNRAIASYTQMDFWASAYSFQVGNVGIGTTTPGTMLDVNGTAKAQAGWFTTGAINGGLFTSDASGLGSWISRNSISLSEFNNDLISSWALAATKPTYNTSEVTEFGNLYYTDTRARSSISLTTTGTSGVATYDSGTGILNIPNYTSTTYTGGTAIDVSSGHINFYPSTLSTYTTPLSTEYLVTYNGSTGAVKKTQIVNLGIHQYTSGAGVTVNGSYQTDLDIPTLTSYLTPAPTDEIAIYHSGLGTRRTPLSYVSDLNIFNAAKIQNINVSTTTPTINQVLQYNGTQYVPTTFTGSMVYPSGSGIPIVVSGTSWGTTITDNHVHWDAAYTNMGKVALATATTTYRNLNGTYFYDNGTTIGVSTDNVPTYGSSLPLNSDGAYTALLAKENSLGNPPADGYVLSSTAAGVRSWIPASGAGYWTRSGTGLYPSTITDEVRIGASTDLGTYNLQVSGNADMEGSYTGSSSVLRVYNSSSGYGTYSYSSSGIGVFGNSSSGTGVNASSSSSYALIANSTSGVPISASRNPTSTNTDVPIIYLNRNTSETAAAGIGGTISFSMETADGSGNSGGDAIFGAVLSSATSSTSRTSNFIWKLAYGNYAPLEVARMSLAGSTTVGAVLQLKPSDAAPSSPTEGMIYSNSTDHHLYYYNGTAWKQLDN